MKINTHIPALRAKHLLTTALALFGLSSVLIAHQLTTRPLTPQEIKDYSLTGLVKSPGIPTVGVGEPVYLEAQVDTGTSIEGAVVWSILTAPGGSTASIAADVLDPTMPIYNPGDRVVADVAERKFFQPDEPGQYLIRAVVPTSGGDITLHLYITAANYVGVGTIDGTSPSYPQCGLCHNQNWVDDKLTGWKGTNHAVALVEKLNQVGQPGDHFGSHCLSCHTTGYNADAAADNGGFDDVADDVSWVFPTEATADGDPTHWELMPNALKQKANIQCEACHGPGSEHGGAIGQNEISFSLSAGDCAQCHDSEPYHEIVGQWEQSRHAVATRYPSGSESRLSCVRCHSGVGFIQYTNGDVVDDFNYEAITCQVCHDPHNGENHHQIRSQTDVTLDDGTVITAGGAGKLCMNCHQARSNGNADGSAYSRRIGPHHGPQADMLAGKTAHEYGMNMPSSGHLTAIENSCVTCHMQTGDVEDVGSHTFAMRNELGEENVASCMNCHGDDFNTFNVAQEDFDGDGTIEGVQDEVLGLLEQIAAYIGNPDPSAGETASVNTTDTVAQFRAAYNYNLILEDGSFGVHNTSYAVAVAKASLYALQANDSDGNGLNDAWELEYFGSVGNDPDADDDGDDLTIREELAQGTDPTKRDTDGDGFTDGAEIQVGSNPLRDDIKPDTNRVIYPAIEILFYAQTGTNYQVQYTEDLSSGVWYDYGDPVDGGDDFVSSFFSTINKPQEYYRILEIAP